MYKNAGIQSRKEAAQRLIDGEVFYEPVDHTEIYFDAEKLSPFRFAGCAVHGMWDTFAAWQVKVDWRESIGDGVLCWVWDDGVEKRVRVVKEYRHNLYFSNEYPWPHAEPLTPEETKKFILGERYDKNS